MENLLERLELWLRSNRPDYLSRLQHGLALEEISEITAPLGFQLPDEVIKLYQWHNGSQLSGDNFFLVYRFLPLKEAVEDTLLLRSAASEYPLGGAGESYNTGFPNHYDWQDNWFTIFYEVKNRIVTVASNNFTTHASIIINGGEDSWTELWFKSLKGFISAILECYETDLYLLEDSEDFCLASDEEIWAKYRDLV
jgi:cell wall assembly regulator SMI1